LAAFGNHHREAFLAATARVDFTSLVGHAVLNLMAQPPARDADLIGLYQTNRNVEVRRRILEALKQVQSPRVEEFLLVEHGRLDWNAAADAALGGVILQAWAAHPNAETVP